MPITLKKILGQCVPPIFASTWHYLRRQLRERKDKVRQQLVRTHRTLNQSTPPGEIALREGIQVKIHPDSRYPFEFFCFGSHEAVAELDCFLELCKGRSRLLDVGALHGIFALAFTAQNPGGTALAVDASPIAFARLLYNAHKNPLGVTAVECALSESSGTIQMHYQWEHAVAGAAAAGGAALTVPKMTGDQLCEQRAFVPDTVKIDVEGHEDEVIAGLASTLKTCRPLLFLELHPEILLRNGKSAANVVDRLTALGYRLVALDGSSTATLGELLESRDIRRAVFAHGG